LAGNHGSDRVHGWPGQQPGHDEPIICNVGLRGQISRGSPSCGSQACKGRIFPGQPCSPGERAGVRGWRRGTSVKGMGIFQYREIVLRSLRARRAPLTLALFPQGGEGMFVRAFAA
jgi:hypothetical protein